MKKALIIFVFFTIQSFSFDLENGLIGFYPFNGNAQDESVNNNHGIVHGATLTEDYCGNPNSAYFFDGIDDYIDLGYSDIFNFSGSITLSAWIYIDETTPQDCYVISKWKTAGSNAGSWSLNHRKFNVSANGSNSNQTVYDNTPLNEFVLITGVYDIDKNIIEYYVNCDKVEEVAGPGSIHLNQSSVIVGASIYFKKLYFKGVIDEVRIYDRALTNDEVCYLYNINQIGVSILGKKEICEDETIELKAYPFYDNFEYVWYNGSNEESVYIDEPGEYYIEVRNPKNCIGYDTINIVESNLEPKITGQDEICEGTTATLRLEEDYHRVLWNNQHLQDTLNIDKEGEYFVEVRNIYGCIGYDTIFVELLEINNPDIIIEGNFCDDEKVILSSKNDYIAYEWSNGKSSKSITITEPGIYTLTVTNEDGCRATSQIEVPPGFFIDYFPENINFGEICEGEFKTEYFYIFNPNDNDVIIDSIKSNEKIKISPDKSIEIPGNDSVKIDLNIFGKESGEISEVIKIFSNEICNDVPEITITGSILDNFIQISVYDTIAKPKYNYCIPVFGKINCISGENQVFDYQLKIKIPNNLFEITHISKGEIDSAEVFENYTIYYISDKNVELFEKEKLINYLCGNLALKDSLNTKIDIIDISINSDIDAMSRSGNIAIQICEIEHQKLILVEQPTLSISPNPTSDILNINCKSNKNENLHSLSLYSSEGKLIKKYNIRDYQTTNISLQFETRQLASGLYFIVLKTQNWVLREKVLIID